MRSGSIALFGCFAALACSHGTKSPEVPASQAITAKGRLYKAYFDPIRERVTANAQTLPQEPYPAGDYYTVLAVVLSPDGKVVGLSVDRSCGVPGIDRVALLAFVRSQPFPQAPPQLVDASGRVRFQFGIRFRETSPGSPESPSPVTVSAELGKAQCLADLNDEKYRLRLPPALDVSGAVHSAVFEVCVSASGEVTSVAVIQSSGQKAIDDAWMTAMKTWPYRPYTVNGRAVPFCHPFPVEVRAQP